MRTVDYRDGLLKRLKNRKYALGVLKRAFKESCEDRNWAAFRLILQNVIEAQGYKLAKRAGTNYQPLYRLFREEDNPESNTKARRGVGKRRSKGG